MGGGGSPFAQPSSKPSPFEADKARKEREEMSAGVNATATVAAPAPMAFSSQPAAASGWCAPGDGSADDFFSAGGE